MDDIYCLIKVINIKKIDLYFIKNKIVLCGFYNYPICFTAFNTNLLILLLKTHDLVGALSLEHYIYLGKELSRIEVCIFSSQEYTQN